MVLGLGGNLDSIHAQRMLDTSSSRLGTASKRLASGLRINDASDDAAGLSIAKSLNVNARVYTQGIRNLNDGLSYLSIASGVLDQLSTITMRQKELAEQSANGVYSLEQRSAMDQEANALAQEFNRIVQSTKFNGRNILDIATNGGDLRLQAGFGIAGGFNFDIGSNLARTVGTGTFIESQVLGAGENWGPTRAVNSGDFNGDGVTDIISTQNNDAGPLIQVLLGNNDGSFLAPIRFDSSDAASQQGSRSYNPSDCG